MKCDFHIHSTFSDGSVGIKAIFNQAKKQNIDAIAITDHDTILGLDLAQKYSKEYSVPYIPGVEFTAIEDDLKFHILAYDIDIDSKELKEYSQNVLNTLNNKSKKQIRLMQNNGIDIDEEIFFDESNGGPLYRAKILKVLSDYGYIKREDIMEKIKPYFSNSSPYYVEDDFEYYDFKTTCDIIHRNSGIVVLAHPNKIKSKNRDLYYSLLSSELIDGIEVYHPSNSEEVRIELERIANDRNLIITGGSDFHGEYNKNKIQIGDIQIPDKVYKNLEQYLHNK
ncbi:PHP domain-containing protein [Clostridiaceae bacterium M8S5]|nr:PHP domain-containing protein [Clostridiaceae bacterium M8S5]